MNRKIIAIIMLGLVLLASLLTCGYFGMKTIRRTSLRRAAMTAYEKKDYALAERLLRQYVAKDPNAEAEFVALANIYHEFGNTGMEAQMWQTASSLNPLKSEYYDNMLFSAVRAASYPLLQSILGRKNKMGEKLTDQELFLFMISSYRSGHSKEGNDAYKAAVKNDPETFQRNELGQMAEFMAKYETLSAAERDAYLVQAANSEDPVIRFEALYIAVRLAAQQNNDNAAYEELLKQIVDTNYYAGTPLLADYFFSESRFQDVIEISEPYLKTIDDLNTYLMYAESLIFTGKIDELRDLEIKLRKKPGFLPFMADYCLVLIAYMEDDEDKLDSIVRKTGMRINTPLSRFIRLRVAIESNSPNEIQSVAQSIFSNPPFHDLSNRAMIICLEYLSEEMNKSENRNDLSRMAELAKILSAHLQENQLLTEIIVTDQFKKGLAKENDLLAALDSFPDDPLLQRVTAEYLVLNGKAEQALPILEGLVEAAKEDNLEPDRRIRFLHMLALDLLERHDEAAAIFSELLEQSEFDLDILSQYFQFSWSNNREEDMLSLADKLDTAEDANLKSIGSFFRAAAMLVSEDKSKENEALDILASTPTDYPEFTFYAANRLSEHDRLDEAKAKYMAILKTYKMPALILINLSELYHEKGDEAKALETAKDAFDMEKETMLPAFIYAKRLSEAKRYEEAMTALNFPHHAVNYREDVVELWVDCMHHVIENSITGERYMQAEDQCKHLLMIAPDDEFGKENLENVQKLIKQQNDKGVPEQAVPAV